MTAIPSRYLLRGPWSRRKSKNQTKRKHSGGTPAAASRGGCDDATRQRPPLWPRWSGWPIVGTGPYYTGTYGLAWGPDGKLAYTSKSGGGLDLWVREVSEPATPKRLTSDNAFAMNPQITADGKQLFFTSNRTTGVFHVWMLDIPTATIRQITTGEG